MTLPSNFKRFPLPGGGGGRGNPLSRILREGATLTRAYRNEPWDVLHSPHSYLPLRVPSPTVLTLADLRILRYPQTFSRLRGMFLRWMIPRSLRRATITLAMSEATRQETLLYIRGISPDRIRVAYPGVDSSWLVPPSPEMVRSVQAHLQLPEEYLLTVGSWEPHKNLPRVVDAFYLMKEESAFQNLHLMMVGATFSTGTSDNLTERLSRHKFASLVHSAGIISDEYLHCIYRSAKALLFPSLYEGFGYPPLEAMASGIPVVTSNLSCLPEIVGTAAELVDPFDIGDMVRGLKAVLGDKNRQSDLRQKGIERVKKYRWDSHAEAVIVAYRDCIT